MQRWDAEAASVSTILDPLIVQLFEVARLLKLFRGQPRQNTFLFRLLRGTQQFLRTVCGLDYFSYDALGLDVEDIPELDDTCGPGTSDIELTPEEYVSIIRDAIDLLESFEQTVIPEDDIDGVCEVS